LREVDLETYQHLQNIRGGGSIEQGLTFSYKVTILGDQKVIDLVPEGRNKQVTEENKEEYIRLLAKAKLQTEIEGQAGAIRRGILEILPEFVIESLREGELEVLLCGPVQLELEELSKQVEYKGCSVYDECVQWLWEILEQFSNENRRRFLHLVTGSSTISNKALNEVKIQIVKKSDLGDKKGLKVNRWLNEIELSEKVTKEVLKESLETEINQEN